MNSIHLILKHAHSGFRWVVLALLILAIIKAFSRMQSGASWTEPDRRRNFLAMTALHIQLLVGMVLYFISPYVRFVEDFMSVPLYRFYAVEHSVMMLLAVALVSIGYGRANKKESDRAKFKTTFWFYLIGLIIILAAIPWPMRNLGGGWY